MAALERFVLALRPGFFRQLEKAEALRGARVVWSQWDGYLAQGSTAHLRAFVERNQLPMQPIHASGHASVPELQRLVEAFSQARVVPIHSEATDRFAMHFPRVEQQPDGAWWTV